MVAAVKALFAGVALVVAAIGHLSSTHTVKTWQDRQATKLECGLAVTALREDLVDRYCVTASGSAATSR
jgi:hypothetical protein